MMFHFSQIGAYVDNVTIIGGNKNTGQEVFEELKRDTRQVRLVVNRDNPKVLSRPGNANHSSE